MRQRHCQWQEQLHKRAAFALNVILRKIIQTKPVYFFRPRFL
jgi:hypothetical protein